MKKAVVYASDTGNTEMMANAVMEGAKASGADVYFETADNADASEVLGCDVIFLGSAAMGAEVLHDNVEALFQSMEGSLSGKKIGIFGSYDWGDGQWLRDWAARITAAGGTVINGEGLMAHLTPEPADLDNCRALGAMN
ncbi:MAG: flavodoxin domain-containing protein [Treponema sp.]|nr:flavodoxin domain-containing protein [Treponema sp.]